jgi:signal peptidase I
MINWKRLALITVIAAVAVMLAGCAGRGGRTYKAMAASMEPTIHCARPNPGCEADDNDRVVAKEPSGSIKRGDIVLVKVPPLAQQRCGTGGTFISRVIGLPGETWAELQGYIYIDGNQLHEPYVDSDHRDFATFGARKIASGNYLVMGDARASSCDSRVWGTVAASKIVGKVVKIESA